MNVIMGTCLLTLGAHAQRGLHQSLMTFNALFAIYICLGSSYLLTIFQLCIYLSLCLISSPFSLLVTHNSFLCGLS